MLASLVHLDLYPGVVPLEFKGFHRIKQINLIRIYISTLTFLHTIAYSLAFYKDNKLNLI